MRTIQRASVRWRFKATLLSDDSDIDCGRRNVSQGVSDARFLGMRTRGAFDFVQELARKLYGVLDAAVAAAQRRPVGAREAFELSAQRGAVLCPKSADKPSDDLVGGSLGLLDIDASARLHADDGRAA